MEGWNSFSYDWKRGEDGKFHSASFDRNHEVILKEMKPLFEDVNSCLEIGSGTGEHIRLWAGHAKHVEFFPSEVGDVGQTAIRENCSDVQNIILPPLALDLVKGKDEALPKVDLVVAVNLFHVVAERAVESFAHLCLDAGAKKVAIYGPFTRHGGVFTTESNKKFHDFIREANSDFGLRCIDSQLVPQFEKYSFQLERITDMPNNNFFVVFANKINNK